MGDEIAEKALRPEKSVPGPSEYNVKKDKVLPNLGKGGGSLLAA